MTSTVFASSVFFQLTIAGNDLGAFHSCEGLGAQVEVEQFTEGGNNGFTWQLPSRISWSNITMTRPVTADSAKVLAWFNDTLQQVERKDGEIVALAPDLTPIVRWQVLGIVPIRWQGPSFDPSSSQVATETLEFAHEGLQAS
ncbi:phage tail protein [Saccharothrix coeruleofusca]|uniref:Phage tail protein n=1 Tax=Saccharothrix coeruleofusca TaxID=33919 RepID=A0A918EH39_9PSEU|nr:phage tail protein [Saccharothrix coeruleofusca]MBP2335961.1 phage tail-like protein [Saccharothrix coeruleofusca]GGP76335.1 phage tail protein [Saccharothrix coeruleofusca]